MHFQGTFFNLVQPGVPGGGGLPGAVSEGGTPVSLAWGSSRLLLWERLPRPPMAEVGAGETRSSQGMEIWT